MAMILEVKDGQVIEVVAAKGVRARLKRALMALPDEAGQSLIEFAMVAPVFLTIVLGIFAFGIGFNNWEELTEATNVGARAVAISRSQTLDPCNTAVTAIQAAAPGLDPTKLVFTFSFNGVSYSGVSCSSSASTTGAAANLVQGSTAQLNVTYPCNLLIYKTNYASSCLLHAQTTELVQ